jgi:hypothetical protein
MKRLWIFIMFPIMAGCSSGNDKQVQDAYDASVDLLDTRDVTDTVLDDMRVDGTDSKDLADNAQPDDTNTVDVQDSGVNPDTALDTNVEVAEYKYPPRALPFSFTRPAEGDPIPAAETEAFTKKVTGFWKRIDWARWVLRTSEGVDWSTGKEDFLGWYNDVTATKSGDTVTFACHGGEHNMWIPGSIVLSEAMAGYLLTGDWMYGKLAEQYCKGLSAVIKGFVWDENDPAPYLMARSIFPMDNSFTLDADHWHDDGRKKVVTYHDMYHDEDHWNAHTFAWPHNPTWGAEYVTNMRSKDDVRAIVRTAVFLHYLIADAKDDYVRQACQETLDELKGFNKDIVDSGYNIRTKDRNGKAYVIPCSDQDLGSYVCYTKIDPRNECCARLTADFIGYGEQRTEDCGNCVGSIYDAVACSAHFYNYPIIWDYHMAAIGNALVFGDFQLAYRLLEGLRDRVDSYDHPSKTEPGPKNSRWFKEYAVMLVQAASVGLPLTWLEARIIQKQWSQAVDEFSTFKNWDPWASEVPDGKVNFRPRASDNGINIQAITMFMEYCASPFKNPAGVKFVDCDIVKDMSKWGE